jgi:hypothetical protein
VTAVLNSKAARLAGYRTGFMLSEWEAPSRGLQKIITGGSEMAKTEQGPSTIDAADLEKISKMKVKVLYRETGESRYCTLDEAKTWDWGSQDTWRIVSGWQITSFKGLLSMMNMKAQKGLQEVEILESPRCLMLAGG